VEGREVVMEEMIDNIVSLPEENFELINEYNLLTEQEKKAKQRKEEIKFQLMDLMGNSRVGICCNSKLSLTPQVRETIETKALKIAHPEIYNQFVKRTETLVFRITNIKG